MKLLIYIVILIASNSPQLIFDFSKESDIQNWRTVDDIVMGG